MEIVIEFFKQYVSIPGLLLLFAGIALFSARSKFNLSLIVFYLGILLAGLGLVALLETVCIHEIGHP